jgi:hypothetical protein
MERNQTNCTGQIYSCAFERLFAPVDYQAAFGYTYSIILKYIPRKSYIKWLLAGNWALAAGDYEAFIKLALIEVPI